MKTRIISSFFVVAVMLCACQSNEVMESKNVVQSEIHQQYFITYDLSDETFYVNAEFRVAGPTGTTLVLSEPSDVTCNDEELKLETYLLGGAHYSLSKSADAVKGEARIHFIDHDKHVYKNDFKVKGIDVAIPAYLLKDSNNVIQIKTQALEANESMWLYIQGDSVNTQVQSISGNISVTPNDLTQYGSKEKLTLQVIREKSGNLKNTTARGGTYSVTSRSRKVISTVK